MNGHTWRTIDGKKCLNETVYCNRYGYTTEELEEAIRDGLPYKTYSYPRMTIRYFNLEDCQKWHEGS